MNFSEEVEAGMHPRIIHFHFSDRSTTAQLTEIDTTSGDRSPVSVYKGRSTHVVQGHPDETQIEITIPNGKYRIKPGGGPHSVNRSSDKDTIVFYALCFAAEVKQSENVIVSHIDEHVCDPTGPCG